MGISHIPKRSTNLVHLSCFKSVGYLSLWSSASCKESLDVSSDFTFQVIKRRLAGHGLDEGLRLATG